jgi:hypothetical protein
MVIRGKAVLAAQQAVTTTGDAYAAQLTQQLLAARSTARLRAAIPAIQGNPAALHLIRMNLFQRLMAVRSAVILDIKQYIDGYSWYALDTLQGVNLDPLKEIGDFFNDSGTIQAAIARATAGSRAQTRTFTFASSSIDKGFAAIDSQPAPLLVADENFINTIKQSRIITFSIDPTLPCFDELARLRLKSFSIRLKGVETPFVSFKVRLGEEMADLALTTPVATSNNSQLEPDMMQIASDRILHFSSIPLTMGHAYATDANGQTQCIMAGTMSKSTWYSGIFRTWTVKIGQDVDLDGLTGFTLRADCEASVLPYGH